MKTLTLDVDAMKFIDNDPKVIYSAIQKMAEMLGCRYIRKRENVYGTVFHFDFIGCENASDFAEAAKLITA